jgi:hypothetical protein
MKMGMLIAAVLLATVISQSHAATITVTSTNDSGPGTLRFALANASDGDTINFSVTGTILLTSGQLLVTNSVDIIGPGPDLLAVNGNAASRVFHIGSNTVVNISSLTVTNGDCFPAYWGGGIYNDHATLIVSNVTLSGNVVGVPTLGKGGGIYNDGRGGSARLEVANSTLDGNRPSLYAGYGGGIYNDGSRGSALLQISSSTLSHNGDSAHGGTGGGIFNYGYLGTASAEIVNSAVSSNFSEHGGGIYNGGAHLQIVNSTMSSNSAERGGGIENFSLESTATVQIANTTLSGNSAFISGGGIDSSAADGVANVEIVNSTVSSNWAGSRGGGLENDNISRGTATVQISDSTLSYNWATAGGGIDSDGGCSGFTSVEITSTTLSRNSAYWGGGIDNADGGSLRVVDSTLSSNSAIRYGGGGIYNSSECLTTTVVIVNSTLSDNTAPSGSGIYNVSFYSADASVEIGDTILDAGGSGGTITNVSGTITSLGYNLSSDDGGGFLTATGDQVNTDPMLGPLQDNGGPTFTCALLPGSPAINAGDPNFTPPPYFDQRGPGFPRVVCGRIDIGAFEVQDTTPPDIMCPADIVTNAISTEGVEVSFEPTASDNCGVASLTSTPASGSLFAIGDTTVTCTAVDTSSNQATCSFTVHVKGAEEQIRDLIVLVQGLGLPRWQTISLIMELDVAAEALRRGDDWVACGSLDAFLDEVSEQRGRLLRTAQADLLIADATRIRAVIGCHRYPCWPPGHIDEPPGPGWHGPRGF